MDVTLSIIIQIIDLVIAIYFITIKGIYIIKFYIMFRAFHSITHIKNN